MAPPLIELDGVSKSYDDGRNFALCDISLAVEAKSFIALVGASDKSTFSAIAYNNLVQFGFGDRTYLVNRRGVPTHGQPTVTSCAQIGEPVDVAYLMVPQAGTLDALDDAAAAGIRNACVLSSGYAEAGEAGRKAQAELSAHAAGLGIVLLGPNHLGFANLTDGDGGPTKAQKELADDLEKELTGLLNQFDGAVKNDLAKLNEMAKKLGVPELYVPPAKKPDAKPAAKK